MMNYSSNDVKKLILEIKEYAETEIIEYKEAKINYSFKEIGQYFSALSNEASIRNKSCGWLFFGISDNGELINTQYRNDGNLQSLKKEIAAQTNERITFLEIYEIDIDGNRVIAFQIPAANRGVPTTWNGAAFARENESLCPLPINKLDIIRNQTGIDWSKQIIEDASFDDLDPEAIIKARELFIKKQRYPDNYSNLSDVELLNKASILIKGKVTNTALMLLGKPESAYLFDGFTPRITWTLYNGDGTIKTYEHFDMPLLLAVDKVYSKIRNEKYRYISGQLTLFPDEVNQYEPEVIREAINNCIAHSDYRLHGKINVEEFEDKLIFINEGSFIPETIESTLESGYKPPYYRNSFLCNAMVNLSMIDTNSMGIPMMFNIQKNKCFPLPTYDLSIVNRVKVTLYGQILDKNYTQLLHSYEDLDLKTVFLLDKVQKKEFITKEEHMILKKAELVEGRYPNIFVSYKIADIVGQKVKYVKNRGLTDDTCKELIVNALKKMKSATKKELFEVIDAALPAVLDQKQKEKKLSNLLQKMKNEGIIKTDDGKRYAKWSLSNSKN